MTTSISVADSATPRRGAGWDGYVPSNPAHADMIEKTIADVGEQHRDDIYLIYVAGFGAGCDRTFAETLKAPAVATALLTPDDPSLPAEPDWADPASHEIGTAESFGEASWSCACGEWGGGFAFHIDAARAGAAHVADASGRAVTAKPEVTWADAGTADPESVAEMELRRLHRKGDHSACTHRPDAVEWPQFDEARQIPEPEAGVTEGPEIGEVA